MHPVLQILVLLGLALGGLCVGSFLWMTITMLGYGYSLSQIGAVSAQPGTTPHAWSILMIMQGVSLASVGAGAALMPRIVGVSWRNYFAPRRLQGWGLALGAAALILLTVPFMSAIVAWNAHAHFPAFMHDFEVWARIKEDRGAGLIKFLTQFSSVARLLVGLVVIAVVPAVAEELVFRGVIQKNLVRWFNSRHLGVWLAAAIFSAIHMQFFGFVPRFLLGLLLGYLYEWSGNIAVPIAAHFTQNAFQLLLLYLGQHGSFGWGFDPDSNEALPWPWVLLSGILSAVLLYFLRQRMVASAVPTQMLTLSHDGVAVHQSSATQP